MHVRMLTNLQRSEVEPERGELQAQLRNLAPPIGAALVAFEEQYAACGSPLSVVKPSTLPMLMIVLPGAMTRPTACAIQ